MLTSPSAKKFGIIATVAAVVATGVTWIFVRSKNKKITQHETSKALIDKINTKSEKSDPLPATDIIGSTKKKISEDATLERKKKSEIIADASNATATNQGSVSAIATSVDDSTHMNLSAKTIQYFKDCTIQVTQSFESAQNKYETGPKNSLEIMGRCHVTLTVAIPKKSRAIWRHVEEIQKKLRIARDQNNQKQIDGLGRELKEIEEKIMRGIRELEKILKAINECIVLIQKLNLPDNNSPEKSKKIHEEISRKLKMSDGYLSELQKDLVVDGVIVGLASHKMIISHAAHHRISLSSTGDNSSDTDTEFDDQKAAESKADTKSARSGGKPRKQS